MSSAGHGWGYRCSICGITLPYIITWKECPQCGGKTDPISNPDPGDIIDHEEAMSMMKHRKFEEYLDAEGRR